MSLGRAVLHMGMLSSAATQDNRIPGKIPDFFLPNSSPLLLEGINQDSHDINPACPAWPLKLLFMQFPSWRGLEPTPFLIQRRK